MMYVYNEINIYPRIKNQFIHFYETMFRYIFMKDLKGSPGFFANYLSRIDVSCVARMKCRERYFMITDRDKPYLLLIAYYYHENLKLEILTRRYETMQAAMEDKTEIEKMQEQIKQLQTLCKKETLQKPWRL